MLIDAPKHGKDGVQLAGAYQRVGASTPAPATHGTDDVQTKAQVLCVHMFWQALISTGGAALSIASPAFVAQGSAAVNSAQQARKVAGALVQNIAAADDATDAAEEEVAKWDATISDLIKKLNVAHEKRAAASRTSQMNLARRQTLDDHLQDMTANTSSVLEILQNAKRRKFNGVDL